MANHKILFYSNRSAPWQETFVDAGDGDGGGKLFGTILVQTHIMPNISAYFFDKSPNRFSNMFIYTESDT